ncbi:MAG: hypothetical protein N2111_13930, partial [Candidatus Sumerlaeaceae bacterium]|nr:hypothetical protein [Candidatus Sumerlaeaceae bacterium]
MSAHNQGILSRITSILRGARLTAALTALGALALFQPPPAQAGASIGKGLATYYVLGDEAQIIASLKAITSGGVPPAHTAANVNSRLSIVSAGEQCTIYLDEWEDGYDFDPNDPAGTADAKWDPATIGPGEQGPALNTGQVLVLTETSTYVPGSQGVDGGDILYVAGAPVTIVRTCWPTTPGTFMSGNWPLYPTNYWQSEYVVPVGEDTSNSTLLGTPLSPATPLPFGLCDLHVTAKDNNTSVIVTTNNDVLVSQTLLNKGQHAFFVDMLTGYKVKAFNASNGQPALIQAGLVTSSFNSVSRYFTLVPTAFLGDDYLIPQPSFNYRANEPDQSNPPVRTAVYVYPIDGQTSISFTTQSSTTTLTLTTNTVARFVMPFIGPYGVQAFVGARVRSLTPGKRVEVLVTGHDQRDNLDCGWTGIPTSLLNQLGNNIYVPLAPANPLFITPANDNTTIYIDFNNDNVPDQTYTLDRYEVRLVYPPGPGYNSTGAHVYGDDLFVCVWAQDMSEVTPGEPNPDYDQGYSIFPVGLYEKIFGIVKTCDPPALPSIGGQTTVTLILDNAGDGILYNVDVTDVLPTGWAYVPGTTVITFNNTTTTLTPNPTITSTTLFWDLNLTLTTGTVMTLKFRAQTTTGYAFGPNVNRASAYATSQADPNSSSGYVLIPTAEDTVFISRPAITTLSVAKSSNASSMTLPNSQITYTLTVTNTGTQAASGVGVSDPLPPGTSYVLNSTSVNAPTTVTRIIRDELWTRAYDNASVGNLPWAGNWIEAGETDGPTAGSTQIADDGGDWRIRMGGSSRSLTRAADLSTFTNPTLSFIKRREGLDNAGDNVVVQVSSNGGSSWTTLDTFAGPTNDTSYTTHSYVLGPSFATANFRVRFLTSSGMGANDYVFFDDIDIRDPVSRVYQNFTGNPPPSLANGYDLNPGESLTVTFKVTVNQPPPPPWTNITNVATVFSNATTPTSATVTDTLAAISGIVFNDLDGDGLYEPGDGESGLGGIQISLVGAGPDGIFGTGDDIVYPPVTSLGDGTYGFFGLVPQAYRVLAVPTSFPPGWYVTTPPNPFQVTLSAGQQFTNGDIGLASPDADLSVSKTVVPNPAAVGTTITYELIVANGGYTTVTVPKVVDTLPTGTTYLSSSTGCGVTTDGLQVICLLSPLAPGQSTTITIQVLANTTGSKTNTAYVEDNSGLTVDPDPSDNWTTITSDVEPDCNANGVADSIDISTGTSVDCQPNGIPDECETDCNLNGVPDDCDITTGGLPDCNGNGVPDSCDITSGTSLDCQGNGIPDECETDCNLNGVPDDCDITTGGLPDCNGNGVPDSCDITSGTSLDCQGNGIPDECETDCNL